MTRDQALNQVRPLLEDHPRQQLFSTGKEHNGEWFIRLRKSPMGELETFHSLEDLRAYLAAPHGSHGVAEGLPSKA